MSRPYGRSCHVTGKVRFESKMIAEWKAEEYSQTGARLEVYLCPHCKAYHLRHANPQKRG